MLAGGFKSGTVFKVRDSAAFVSKAQGAGGGWFLRIVDPGPRGAQRTVVDGFEITGYAQAIVRDIWYSQSFDITSNHIHDNDCDDAALAGAAFSLVNVSGWCARCRAGLPAFHERTGHAVEPADPTTPLFLFMYLLMFGSS